jgi:deoxyribonuclease V
MDPQEIAKKYGINLKKLEEEQLKLAKQLVIKDSIDFNLAERIAAIDNAFFENKIISACIVVNKDMEILEQEYFSDKMKFPYISGFRAYRELPSMIEAFNKLEEKPDIVFIQGNGIAHPRLGMASHFSISAGVPTIGVANSLLVGEEKAGDVVIGKKVVGKVLTSKPGSRGMYISPGNLISIETAYNLSKKFIRLPHKLPEPLHLAHKYGKDIRKELFGVKAEKDE